MDYPIKRLDAVYTADGTWLGKALKLFKNPDPHDINPKLKLFAEYLLVNNLDLGDSFYVPTDYIEAYSAEENRVNLSLNMKEVEHESLTREPQFIALGKAEKEELGEGEG